MDARQAGPLRLRDGGRVHKLLRIFSNPKLPSIDDYYEPWTYDYENLTSAPLGEHMPVAPPRSLISGKPMKVSGRRTGTTTWVGPRKSCPATRS